MGFIPEVACYSEPGEDIFQGRCFVVLPEGDKRAETEQAGAISHAHKGRNRGGVRVVPAQAALGTLCGFGQGGEFGAPGNQHLLAILDPQFVLEPGEIGFLEGSPVPQGPLFRESGGKDRCAGRGALGSRSYKRLEERRLGEIFRIGHFGGSQRRGIEAVAGGDAGLFPLGPGPLATTVFHQMEEDKEQRQPTHDGREPFEKNFHGELRKESFDRSTRL